MSDDFEVLESNEAPPVEQLPSALPSTNAMAQDDTMVYTPGTSSTIPTMPPGVMPDGHGTAHVDNTHGISGHQAATNEPVTQATSHAPSATNAAPRVQPVPAPRAIEAVQNKPAVGHSSTKYSGHDDPSHPHADRG